MDTSRRSFLKQAALGPAAASATLAAASSTAAAAAATDYERICVEEAFVPTELLDACRRALNDNDPMELGFRRLMGGYFNGKPGSNLLLKRLSDLGEFRLSEMDENGIRKQLLSITAPGV